MTKRLTSKYSVCRKIKSRYKNLWGLNNKDFLRSTLFKNKGKRRGHFRKLLNIKQSYKFFYSNVKEKSFKRLIHISINSHSKTIDKLTSFLESRLDSLLFRSCFAHSFHEARQMINHRFIYVNNFCITNPSKKLFSGDSVSIKYCTYDKSTFLKRLSSRSLPNYLEIDLHSLSFVFLWDPNLKSSFFPVRKRFSKIARYYK